MNLAKNDSKTYLYLLPNIENSEKCSILDNWNYPVKPFELRNYGFLKLTLSKEFHIRKSTDGSPCTDLSEDTFYKVRISFSKWKQVHVLISFPFGSASVKWRLLTTQTFQERLAPMYPSVGSLWQTTQLMSIPCVTYHNVTLFKSSVA